MISSIANKFSQIFWPATATPVSSAPSVTNAASQALSTSSAAAIGSRPLPLQPLSAKNLAALSASSASSSSSSASSSTIAAASQALFPRAKVLPLKPFTAKDLDEEISRGDYTNVYKLKNNPLTLISCLEDTNGRAIIGASYEDLTGSYGPEIMATSLQLSSGETIKDISKILWSKGEYPSRQWVVIAMLYGNPDASIYLNPLDLSDHSFFSKLEKLREEGVESFPIVKAEEDSDEEEVVVEDEITQVVKVFKAIALGE